MFMMLLQGGWILNIWFVIFADKPPQTPVICSYFFKKNNKTKPDLHWLQFYIALQLNLLELDTQSSFYASI